MVTYAAFFPRESTAYNVLVGLLTPKLKQGKGLLTATDSQESNTAMAILNGTCLKMLGHSGGAVPDLHRSSLFCRFCWKLPQYKNLQRKQSRPPTHDPYNTRNLPRSAEAVKRLENKWNTTLRSGSTTVFRYNREYVWFSQISITPLSKEILKEALAETLEEKW